MEKLIRSNVLWLLFVFAAVALLSGLSPKGDLSIDGISLGMSKESILKTWGSPSEQLHGEDYTFLRYTRHSVSIEENMAVIVRGSALIENGKPLLSVGDSKKRVLQVLGLPENQDTALCLGPIIEFWSYPRLLNTANRLEITFDKGLVKSLELKRAD